ncbi:MAG: non-hydrolyzing UDP-N-acetylglucosamine 2-epimerase [Gammaproteobacteria bacterium]
MKIVTVLGTRPEIIRLKLVIEKLDSLCEHVLVHTGQNFHPSLSDTFFEQLRVRQPDQHLGVRGDTFGEQAAQILTGCEKVFRDHRADRLLILGDTNSSLCAIVAKRMGIPVFHMEAGNRCYDDRVPEEVNRRLIDHSSDILMPYTERSRANLLREGIFGDRIFVIGNPIHEVIGHFKEEIDASNVLENLGLARNGYFLVTMHRAENVDIESRLRRLTAALVGLEERYGIPIIASTHPRTRVRMESAGLKDENRNVRFSDPFGFFDFIKLERNARCVLSDSGTVQEECAIFGVPNVTLRDVTERPETVECGSNILSGAEPEKIIACVHKVLTLQPRWTPPPEYLAPAVSDTVVRIVTGYHARLRKPTEA